MFWIAQPKSAGSSFGYTIAEIYNAKCINGLITKPKKYCEEFTELQNRHNTMIPRTKEFLYKYCTGIKTVYKEHILPTKNHLEILKTFNYNIVILLRNPEESFDCYKRFDLNEVKLKYGRSGIVNLKEIRKDIYLFYNRYKELENENYKHLLFIDYKDLIFNFTNTLIKVLNHYNLKIPKNIKQIKLKKIKYTGIGIKRLLNKE